MTDRPGYLLVIPWELEAIGGVSQVVANLQRDLAADGWRARVLVADWAATTAHAAASGGVPTYRWRLRSPWLEDSRVKGALTFLLAFPAFALRWRALVRRDDWRLVNFHYPGLPALAWILLRRLHLWHGAVVLSIHGREVRDPDPPRGPVADRLMRHLLENADAVVACSTELAGELRRFAPGCGPRLRIIANGVDAGALASAIDCDFALPAGVAAGRYILNVATFEYKKAQDVLIDSFAGVAARHADVHLVLAGRNAGGLDTLRRRADDAGLGRRVHFLADLPHGKTLVLLARATLFCLPSRAEGHPIALLEAGALGVPVVATPVGGIPQTIVDGEHGVLVPVGDVPALERALCRLLADPATAATLGGNLQRRVADEFSGARVAQRYAELAIELLSGRRAASRP